ncbi:hypothetical protein DPX39_070045600 [Trypanosoma brucei equiperdum]|uniref:C2 domain-containing protein n=1 Tax=Trypanosoma brucei equiperdum TaxID=630700 RepID=A0A3L6L8K0_9TRYP|nr:hypothetical protein DPX39_070045600 [Trypanosoma brucei equiperdum]
MSIFGEPLPHEDDTATSLIRREGFPPFSTYDQMPVHYACSCCAEINPSRGRNHLLRTAKQEKELEREKLMQINIIEERAKNPHPSIPRPRTSNLQRVMEDEELNQPAIPLPPTTLDELRKSRRQTNTTRLIVTVHHGKSINVDPRDPVSVLVRCGAFEGQTAKVPRGRSAICTWEELFEFPYPNEEEGLEVLVVDDTLPAENDHMFGGIVVPPHALRNRARGDEETLPVCAAGEMHRSYGRMKETPMGSIVVSWYVKRDGEDDADGAALKQNLEGGPINCNFVVHRLFQYTDNGALPYNGGVLCLLRDTDDNCSESGLYTFNSEGAMSSSPYYGKGGCTYLPQDRSQMLQLITPKKLGHVLICVTKDEVENEEDEELIVVGAVPLDFEKLYHKGSAVLLVESKVKEDVLWGEIAVEWGIISYATIQKSNEEDRQGTQMSNDRTGQRDGSGPRESLFLTVVRGLNLTDREGEPLAQGQVSVFACDMEGSTYSAPAVVEADGLAHVITWNQEVRFIEMDGGQAFIDVQVLDDKRIVSSGRFELLNDSDALTVKMHDPQNETVKRGEILVSYKLIRSTEEDDGESKRELSNEKEEEGSSPRRGASGRSGRGGSKRQSEMRSDQLSSRRNEDGSEYASDSREKSAEKGRSAREKSPSKQRSQKRSPRSSRKSNSKGSTARQTSRSPKSTSPKRNEEEGGRYLDELDEQQVKSAEDGRSPKERPLSKRSEEERGSDRFNESAAKSAEDDRSPKERPLSKRSEEERGSDRFNESAAKSAEDDRSPKERPLSKRSEEERGSDRFNESAAKSAEDDRSAQDKPLSKRNEEDEDLEELDEQQVKSAEDDRSAQERPLSKRSEEERGSDRFNESAAKSAEDDRSAQDKPLSKRNEEDEDLEELDDPQGHAAEDEQHPSGGERKKKRSPKESGVGRKSPKEGKEKRSPRETTGKSKEESEKSRKSPKEGKEKRSPRETTGKSKEGSEKSRKSPQKSKEKRTPTEAAGKSADEEGYGDDGPLSKRTAEEESLEELDEPQGLAGADERYPVKEDEYTRSPKELAEEDLEELDEPKAEEPAEEQPLAKRNEEGGERLSSKGSEGRFEKEGGKEPRTVKLDVPPTPSPDRKPPIGKGDERSAKKKAASQGGSEKRSGSGKKPASPEAATKKGRLSGQRDSAENVRGRGDSAGRTRAAEGKPSTSEAESSDVGAAANTRNRSPRSSVRRPSERLDEHNFSISPGASLTSGNWQPWHPTKNASNEDHIPLEKRTTFRNRTETIKQLEMRSRDSRLSSGHPSGNRDSSRRASTNRESSVGRGF